MELTDKELTCLANQQEYQAQLRDALYKAAWETPALYGTRMHELMQKAYGDFSRYGDRPNTAGQYSHQVFEACMNDVAYDSLNIPGAKSFKPVGQSK